MHSNFPLSFRCCGVWPTQGQETRLTTGAVHPTVGPETQKQTTSFPPPLQQLTAWKQTWKNTQKEKHSLHCPVHLHFSVRAEPSPLLTTSLSATISSPKPTNQSTPRNHQCHHFCFPRRTTSVIYYILQVVYIFSRGLPLGDVSPRTC